MSRFADRALRDDVALWQAGELSADELRQRHPTAEVDAALAAHTRLLSWAEVPVSGAGLAWSRVAAALAPRNGPERPRRLRRSVVAAIIATAMAAPAVSYAAAPDAVRSGIRQVADLFTDRHDDDGPRPADDAEPEDSTVEPGAGARATPPPDTGDSSDASETDPADPHGASTDDSSDDVDRPDADDPDADQPNADEPDADAPDPSGGPGSSEAPSLDSDRTEASEEPDAGLSDLTPDAVTS